MAFLEGGLAAHVLAVVRAPSSCGHESALRLVQLEVVGWLSPATKLDHDGAEDDGHALRGLVCQGHIGEGGGETLEILHVVLAVERVFEEG